MSEKATWFAYFPGDYRWSFNMLIVFAMIRTGGAEVGEIDQVGRRLADHIGDDDRGSASGWKWPITCGSG